MAPTRAHASDKDNVIPSRAEVLVDCRVPPGDGAERGRASGSTSSSARLPATSRSSSPSPWSATARRTNSPLASAIAASLAEFDPDAAHRPVSCSRASATATGSARPSTRRPCTASARSASSTSSARRRSSTAPTSGRRSPTSSWRRASTPTSAGGCSVRRGPERATHPPRARPTRRPRSPSACGSAAWRMRNGLLIHGPTSWAVAARAPDGSIEVASGPKPILARGRLASTPLRPRPAAARRGDGDRPARPPAAALGAAAVRGPGA